MQHRRLKMSITREQLKELLAEKIRTEQASYKARKQTEGFMLLEEVDQKIDADLIAKAAVDAEIAALTAYHKALGEFLAAQ